MSSAPPAGMSVFSGFGPYAIKRRVPRDGPASEGDGDYRLWAGDQANIPSFQVLCVTLRRPLPSAFMT